MVIRRRLFTSTHELQIGLRKKNDPDAACFFLTQAFVYALEAGVPQADGLNFRLSEYGRETRHKL